MSKLGRVRQFGGQLQTQGRDLVERSKQQLQQRKEHLNTSIERFMPYDVVDPDLMLIPRDLTTADPSFISELQNHQFGLDDMFVELDDETDESVFDAAYRDPGFNRALHGFGWLRDLGDAMQEDADAEAQKLVLDWIKRYRKIEGLAYEPSVVGRRIMSWLANAPVITIDLDEKQKRTFLRALAEQVAVLQRLIEEPDVVGRSRLTALSALVMAGLCLSRHEEVLQRMTPLLERELQLQILADGGHVSRNPDAVLAILFEIIPVRHCFTGRDRQVPCGLRDAIDRMMPMIRFFRMGDSSLGRFNGQRGTPTDALATLLGYDSGQENPGHYAQQSAYCRLQAGPAIVLCDVGASPPLSEARQAHAGCLSFELSVRHFAMVVNAGAYHGDDADWRRYARSSNAHSTLILEQHSQGGFVENGALDGPRQVQVEETGPVQLQASHNGYEDRFGYQHQRRLELNFDGLQLKGVDRLQGRGGAGVVPFEIRFHLHPFVEIARSDDENLLLTLPDGEIWRFHAANIGLDVDDGVYLAYKRGIEAIHQIVLYGDAPADKEVHWLFEQYRPRPDVMKPLA